MAFSTISVRDNQKEITLSVLSDVRADKKVLEILRRAVFTVQIVGRVL